MSDIIKHLTNKYSLKPDTYYTSTPYGKEDLAARDLHMKEYYQPFYDKWQKYTAEGHYGCMGLGPPCPPVFYQALDEFLDYVLKECPEFKILQLKIKWGSARILIGGVTRKVQDEAIELEGLLFDKFLIY